MARRKKFRKPRHQMKPLYDGGRGLDKPLNRGQVAELDPDTPKAGPKDFNTSTDNLRRRLIYPPPSPFGYIRPPATLRPEINYYPTRFQGTPSGVFENKERLRTHHPKSATPLFKVLFKTDTREVRLWWMSGHAKYLIVEIDTLVRYKKESIEYDSVLVATTMHMLGKISWEKIEVLPLDTD